MPDGRVLEVDPILGVEALPGIAPPPAPLGSRAIESFEPADPLLLADARSFEIHLSAPVLTPDDAALEQGKHRR
jgi:hypothetical protein